LGGGQAATTVSARFFYIAWWHVAVLAILSVAGLFIVHRLLRFVEGTALAASKPRITKKDAV
jgi:hypothetical protein